MIIFETKTEKQINLYFSFKRNAILDFKIYFNEYGLYDITLNFLWVGLSYVDCDKIPF